MWNMIGMESLLLLVTATIATVASYGPANNNEGKEYCERNDFVAQCSKGQLLLMTSAYYGVMRIGGCLDRDYSTKCGTDPILTLRQMDSLCSGLQNCSFNVGEKMNALSSNCPQSLTRQLIVSYSCIKVSTCDGKQCSNTSSKNRIPHIITSSEQTGYLSNYQPPLTSQRTNSHHKSACTHMRPCVWNVVSKPGQTLNFTMYYFHGVGNHRMRIKSNIGCQTVALIKKMGTSLEEQQQPETGYVQSSSDLTKKEVPVEICPGQERMSTFQVQGEGTSRVQITFLTTANSASDNRIVLMHKAIGCPDDIEIPTGTSISREGPSMTVQCANSQKAWHIICDGNAWVGEFGVCESEGSDTGSNNSPLYNVTSSPSGMLVVVGIGLAIGIVLGMCLLMIVMMYMKKSRQGDATDLMNTRPSNPQPC